MKNVICAIYDKAVQAYMRPFTCQTEGQAVRVFEDEVNREGSEFSKHPEDYALFKIADFNDHNAELIPYEPVCLRRAHEIERKNGEV